MVVAALAAFVLNVNLLRGDEDLPVVAVAGGSIEAGTPVTPDLVDFMAADLPDSALERLVPADADLGGMVAAVDIAAGEPISRSLLRTAASENGLRAFTIPVDPSHAGGGDLLAAGDTVDVIAVEGDEARYVVTDASIIDAADSSGSGLVASSEYYLVVAVDADTALALAEALRADSLEVVRTTGADPVGGRTLAAGRPSVTPGPGT